MSSPQTPTTPDLAQPSSDRLVLPGLLLLLTLVAYTPAIFAGYIWDDDFYVTQNQTLRTLDGLRDIWLSPMATPQYYPLVHSSFWIEYQLWELEPRGYHLTNILLHVGCALMVWKIFRQLGWSSLRAWMVGLLFALHPVHVESVAWITERKNVLSGLFYLIAVSCYIKFTLNSNSESAISSISNQQSSIPSSTASSIISGGNHQSSISSDRAWIFYVLTLFFFICALLSKTVTCSLPAVLLLMVWWKRGKLTLRDILPTIPMFLIGAAMGLLTAYIEHAHVGARGDEWNFSLLQRIAIAGTAICFYIWKLVEPINLTFIYPHWKLAAIPWQLVFPLLVAAALVLFWLKRKTWTRGPLAALLFFCITIFPALGFINIYPMRYSLVADHFQYLASLGILAGLVGLAAEMSASVQQKYFKPDRILAVALLVSLSLLTFTQTQIYRDEETLWRDTINKNPKGWLAWNNLGTLMLRDGMLEDAMDKFDRVIKLAPNLFNGYANKGSVLLEMGRPSDALPLLEKAMELGPMELTTRFAMARADYGLGHYEEAVKGYHEVLARQPELIAAHIELAKTFVRMKQDAKAVVEFREALKINPDHIEVLLALAWLHATSADATIQLGNKAVEFAERAAKQIQDPKASCLDTLAAAYARAGRFPEAVTTAQKAAQKAAMNNDASLSQAIEQRLALYRKKQPFTQENDK